ncbi:MAG TPA: hypothetical protein VFE05_14815 [Longimicrobiaceae bacterium]|jgi:hypothetical protein|nr:hypothetical protein [Longimicrobiaceae bacterium]
MNFLKLLVGTAAVGTIVMAFRDGENGRWLSPAIPELPALGLGGGDADDETEPVLGYDGMDRDTLIDWLNEADLDVPTLRRIRAYEMAHQARQSVLDTVIDLLS